MRLKYQDQESYRFNMREGTLDYPLHLHNAIEIIFLQSGESWVTCGEERTWLRAGDVFVVFPNQVHSYERSRDVRRYMLILPVRSYLEPYHKLLMEKRPRSACLRRGKWEHTGLWELLELAYKDKDRVSDAVMQGYFLVILGKLIALLDLQEAGNGAEDALRSILLYIHAHYREPITRRQTAKAAGYNESYVSHVFSQNLKTTFPAYIHALRMEDAQQLLTQTDRSVTQIASMLGFGSIRNFNRVFLHETGLSPKAYRALEK